nr:autotransporter outer membrane beta-barrel domain-containing protein [Neoroseomonas nitratireducens]
MFRIATLDAAGACEGRGGLVQGRFCSWADAYRVNGSLNGQTDLAGFDYSLSGVQSGIEMRVLPDAVVGFSVGYGAQRLSGFEFASRRLEGEALFAGLYGTYGFGPWQAVGLVGYSRFEVDAERNIAVGGISRQARSSFGADGANAAAALRYRTGFAGLRIVPELLVAYAQHRQDGFTETGAGSLNLRVRGTDANSLATGIGVTASTDWIVGGATLRPMAGLRYEHDWLAGSKDDHRIDAAFAEVPQAGSWTVYGQNRGRDSLSGRVGIAADVAAGIAVYGGLAGQWNTTGTEWGFGGGLRMAF